MMASEGYMIVGAAFHRQISNWRPLHSMAKPWAENTLFYSFSLSPNLHTDGFFVTVIEKVYDLNTECLVLNASQIQSLLSIQGPGTPAMNRCISLDLSGSYWKSQQPISQIVTQFLI